MRDARAAAAKCETDTLPESKTGFHKTIKNF
jgi:hypothetical protein